MTRISGEYPPDAVVTERDAVRQFLLHAPAMIKQARIARGNDANSYRKLHVGAVAFGVNPYTGEIMTSARRGNIKPNPDTETVCAEPPTIEEIENAGMFTVGVVTAATNNKKLIEGITGHRTDTLHPCWRCMAFIDSNKTTLGTTLVLTGGGGDPLDRQSKSNIYQMHTVDDLGFIYGEPSTPEFDQGPAFHNLRFAQVPLEYDRIFDKQLQRGGLVIPTLVAKQALANCTN